MLKWQKRIRKNSARCAAAQVSYFKGVSRFLLSNDECAACAGTGYELDTADEKGVHVSGKKPKKRKHE